MSSNKRVLSVGEVLWDMLPDGPQLGGAPANVAFHARALGADARLISRVGNDPLGKEALDKLSAVGMSVDFIETDDAAPTGTVDVQFDTKGEPHYTIREGVAWDLIRSTSANMSAAARCNALCFGTLAQRSPTSHKTIQDLVTVTAPSALRVYDINLRPPFVFPEIISESLSLANVVKLNEAELEQLGEMIGLRGKPRLQIRELAERFELRAVAVTRGDRGCLLYADGRFVADRGVEPEMVDPIGAGDSFTAALMLGILEGWELELVAARANLVASCVCSARGAMPPLPESCRNLFNPTFPR